MNPMATAVSAKTLARGSQARLPGLFRLVMAAIRGPWIPVALLAGTAIVAILAPWIAPYSPTLGELGERLQAPSLHHLLGTDTQGRDVLSRLMVGSRATLAIAFCGVAAAGTIGTIMGLLAGYYGGLFDHIVMRVVDLSFSVPALVVALALAAAVGPSILNLVLVIVLVYWGMFARQVRAETLSLRARQYVEASKATGAGNAHIIIRHIFPNIIDTIAVIASLNLGLVILLESALTFLGAGIPSNLPSWGRMIDEGKGLLAVAWWLSVGPGLAIVLLVLSVNMLGDWLRDHLDPRLRRR